MTSFVITKSKAQEIGCTHSGTLFGIPAWIGDIDSNYPLVVPKNILYSFLFILGEAVFSFGVALGFLEPLYPIVIKGEIE